MSNAKEIFVEVPAGATVFRQGESGSELYIIESGQIELIQNTPGGDVVCARLGPGEFFGEAALGERQSHAVTALSKVRSRLLRIERAEMTDVVRQNAEIAMVVLRQLIARLQPGHGAGAVAEAPAASRPAASVPAPSPPPAPPPPPPAAAEPAPTPAPPPPASAPAPAPAPAGLGFQVGGQVIVLNPQRDEFLVGRPDPSTGSQPEIDLGPFDDARTLSRRHAKIMHKDGTYFVCEEKATTNGTYLNGERLAVGASMPLKPGDTLRFGSIQVQVIGV